MQIVLAWLVEDFEVVKAGRSDLGERPELRTIWVPRTAMWLRDGDDIDVRKASAHAAKQTDYSVAVFTYPKGERDPLGKAKRDLVELMKRGGI